MPIIYSSKRFAFRSAADFYPTPRVLTKATVNLLPGDFSPVCVIDPGAGRGEWGFAIRERWPRCRLIGIELFNKPSKENATCYDVWQAENFLVCKPLNTPDLIIGNPPYDDWWVVGQKIKREKLKRIGKTYRRPLRPESAGPVADAEAFVRRSLALLEDRRGYLLFLLRTAFVESRGRGYDLWVNHKPMCIYHLIERPSFTGDGKTDAMAYSLFLWRAGHVIKKTYCEWLSWR